MPCSTKTVAVTTSGESMVNAALTTQLFCDKFKARPPLVHRHCAWLSFAGQQCHASKNKAHWWSPCRI